MVVPFSLVLANRSTAASCSIPLSSKSAESESQVP